MYVVHRHTLSDNFWIWIAWFQPKQDSDRIRISFFKNRIGSDSENPLSDHLCCTGMIKGTLQMILSRPRGIILFSESTVRIYHSLARSNIVYIDATGSVLLGDKSCYVYEIVVRHPNQGNPPLAVALSCTRLRIRLNTICGKPGFNSLMTPLNHGASYTKDASKETLKQYNSVTYRMLPRTGKLHKKNTLQ